MCVCVLKRGEGWRLGTLAAPDTDVIIKISASAGLHCGGRSEEKKGEKKKNRSLDYTHSTEDEAEVAPYIFSAHTVPIQRRVGPPTHKTLVAHVVAGPPGILGVGEGVHTAARSEGPTAERLGA